MPTAKTTTSSEPFAELKALLLPSLAAALQELPAAEWERLQEIRLRIGQPVRLRLAAGERTLPLLWQQDWQERQLMLFLHNSVYAYEEQLRQGFVTLPGGHRVGLVGEAWFTEGELRGFKHIASLNIRLARAVPGVAKPFLPYIVGGGRVLRTLLAAPPGVGKTTLLRDLVRILAEGEAGLPPLNIGLADERMEIAAAVDGCPQLPVGSRCDVISACSKAQAVMILLRSMGPQLVVTDEVGSQADCEALAAALNAGVSVLASAHGGSLEELLARPWLGDLLREGFFERLLLLKREPAGLLTALAPAAVYDGQGRQLC